MPFSLSATPRVFPTTRGLFLLYVVGVAVMLSTDTPSVHTLTITSSLSASSVDLGGFWKRVFGQTELVKEVEGYNQGRVEEVERRANGLGAFLAILVILTVLVWGLTGYAWWRLHTLRRDPNAYNAPPMASPMMPMMSRMQAFPSMSSIMPQSTGPRLVSQKVVSLPGGSSPVRLA